MPKEKEILKELLFNRESAIAFDWQEKGRIKTEIESPHIIRIRPGHIPCQERPMKIPHALTTWKIKDIFCERKGRRP